MALSDLTVFSEQAYSAATELLAYQYDLFNAASAGTIVLGDAAHMGDFSETAMFGLLGKIVRRRNPYGDSTQTPTALRHINEVSVKVAAGTQPVSLDRAWFDWIKQSPAVAGAALGQQLAQQMVADMVDTAVGASVSAISQNANLVYDATGKTVNSASWKGLLRASALFGDQSSAIQAWVMRSETMVDLYAKGLDNNERLFSFGTVNVMRDPFGRIMVIADNPRLIGSQQVGGAAKNVYNVLGLTSGAITVQRNGDYNDNTDTRNGGENIATTYQAEWSYQLALKGYAWDKESGGKAPTDAALMVATNWDQYVTSERNTSGVLAKFLADTTD